MNPIFRKPETSRHYRGLVRMLDNNVAVAKKRANITDLTLRSRPSWHIVEDNLTSDASLAMFVIGASPYRSPHKSDKDRFEIRTVRLHPK